MIAGALLDNRYRLEARIGHGAVGDVWRARDLHLGREVAVKTVRMGQGATDVVVGRFRREVDAAAALNHGNVVSLHDAGKDDQVAYLVMELLEGPSVADLVATQGPATLDQGLAIGEDVARGLMAAHRAGIVHRDVKPANAVLHQGGVKVVDFGIARLTEGNGETLTEAGFITGTAAYVSPEQARGDKVDTPSDIYSLGCLLMALFTGQPPFPRDLPVAQALAHLTDEAPRLRAARPDLPQDLDDLVAAMLAKDPAVRPTAAQVADALAALRAGERTAVLPTVAAPPPVRPARRWPALAAAGVLVAGLAFGAWQARPQDPGDALARLDRTVAPAAASATPATAPSARPTPFAADGEWTPVPAAPSRAPVTRAPQPTQSEPPPAAGPAQPTGAAPAPFSLAGRGAVDGAIAGVQNPGGRRQLERAWSTQLSGMTAANAAGRLDRFAATVRDTPQLSGAERQALLGAIASARAGL